MRGDDIHVYNVFTIQLPACRVKVMKTSYFGPSTPWKKSVG